MKKLIFISLLIIPFCKAADTDYYQEAQNAAIGRQWQDVYRLIEEGKLDANKHELLIKVAVNQGNLEAVQKLLDEGFTWYG